ncbi:MULTISPECIES: SsrA-binding protein SmpB [Limibacillus]|jgi:SsrA-binding protein|uniref:SsrA-binding protein n=1 Tax=Limibacillus halophilus TaxID=1579333 RepID=A0A839SNI0_9PROT|nr:SsrA-binding protein SmpB [Limibacillus halophilus]MBB3064457.1 SsrA-binding protein [Limibacillus halophilus]
MAGTGTRVVAVNRRARHEYFIEDTLEVGLVLMGSEVKALRAGHGSIKEAYAREQGGELYLFGCHISEFAPAARENHSPLRPRKLLLHRRELGKLLGKLRERGATLVPLSLYFNERGVAKLELGLARGKKKADKRETEKQRDWDRQKSRLVREYG